MRRNRIAFVMTFVLLIVVSALCFPADGLVRVQAYDRLASADISHPYPQDVMRWMLASYERTIFNLDSTALAAEAAPYMEMTISELTAHIDAQERALPNIVSRPAHERATAVMGIMYDEEKDEEIAKRVVVMLHRSAIAYDNIPKTGDVGLRGLANQTPGFCVFAYDKVYNSPYWDELSGIEGVNVRREVENWFIKIFDRLYSANKDVYINNVGPFWIKHLAGMAIVLNDPDRVRDVVALIDNACSPKQWFADGMWSEVTFSYGIQMSGNLNEAISVLSLYTDPEGYTDSRFGLKFGQTVNLRDRWPIMREMIRLNNTAKYPDGSVIAINDTHPDTKSVPAVKIIPEHIAGNIELNYSGLFGIKYGNERDAQQMNLDFHPIAEGLPYVSGHYHGGFLGMTLWSAGMELLPDGGYVSNTGANRYIHMDAFLHNVSWISSLATPSYSLLQSQSTRPNLLAYDDGSKNDKQVQLIEVSQPMTQNENIEMKKRLLVMVATDANHSYVLDVQRLKGGTIHENFLRQVEEEDVTMETELILRDYEEHLAVGGGGQIASSEEEDTSEEDTTDQESADEYLSDPMDTTLGAYLKSQGLSGGLVINQPSLTSPQVLRTGNDFKFSWKGVDSGSTLQAFIKGNPNAVIAFSKFPTMRRVRNNPDVKDDYLGYHFYQRKDVSPEDVTVFGGLYEGYRSSEDGKVRNVNWETPADGDSETVMVKVELDNAVDYIYISSDANPRAFAEFTFAGSYAAVRKDKETGNIMWAYMYGDGTITGGGLDIQGKANQNYKVMHARGSFTGKETPNQITVRGLPYGELSGVWCNVTFGDKSGYGYKIKKTDQSVITVQTDPAFKITEQGAGFTYFPMMEDREKGKVASQGYAYLPGMTPRVVEGDVWLEIKTPTYVKLWERESKCMKQM